MVRTVKQLTGLPVHHYIEVDFVGFQSLVDDIGGVYLDFPYPARDANSGLSVEAGYQLLDGSQALAYARSRHYEEERGGKWVPVDADDIGRTGRQQSLILAILGAVKTPSSISEAGSIVGGFAQHLTVDSAFARSSIVDLAFRMRSISGQKIETATLPVYLDTFEEMSIVRMQHPEADELIAHFASGQPMTVAATRAAPSPGSQWQWHQGLRRALVGHPRKPGFRGHSGRGRRSQRFRNDQSSGSSRRTSGGSSDR